MRRAAWARLATAAFLALTPLAARARNLALVIGNDQYQNVPRLRTAVADAQAVGYALERLGFIVRRASDADHRAISGALAAFDSELGPGDEAFIYYAGHGVEISGTNYILPTDVPAVRVNQPDLVRDASFPVSRIIDGVRQRGTRVTILVLDACRDNPFAAAGSRSAATLGGLARVDAPEGVFVLMSAGAKQQALDRLSPDDTARDSVFTRAFLDQIAKPGRTLVEIAKATQVAVRDLAATVGYEQTPAYYDQVIGDIVLSGPATSNVPSVASPQPPAGGQRQMASVSHSFGNTLQLGGRAPIANFMRSSSGWTATLSLPEPALEVFYRLGDAGAFKSTGLSDTLDQRTGERMPNLSFPMSARTGATTIEVRFTTSDGGSVGPFAIPFDPYAALFTEEKKILEQLQPRWAEFHESDGPLVFFTLLVTYRCAITDVRYGLDDGAPLTAFDLPSCRPNDPFAVPPAAKLFLRVPRDTRSVNLRITWRDGTQSDISTIDRN